MPNPKLIIRIAIPAILILVAVYFFGSGALGGKSNQSDHGCRTAEQYEWNEKIGACARTFEMTPDIEDAARLAVLSVGQEYGLSVASFNSYEEVGAYDIVLAHEKTGESETVYIRDGKVTRGSDAENSGSVNAPIAGVTCVSKGNIDGAYEHKIFWIPGYVRQNFWNTAIGASANKYDLIKGNDKYTWNDISDLGTRMKAIRPAAETLSEVWTMYSRDLYICTEGPVDESLFAIPTDRTWR